MKKFDITIIGAGIIGLSTAYQLLKKDPSLRICMVEKEPAPAMHQSGNNSGVIHSGVYYKPGSLKAANCIRGYKMLLEFCDSNEIPYEICGKIIVATNENELGTLQLLFERGKANGLEGVRIISPREIKEFEPEANGVSGLHVPQTGIVDYKRVCEKLLQKIIEKNCEVIFSKEVRNVIRNGNDVISKTTKHDIQSKYLIACAGLYSDKIALMSNRKINFRIIPFRGEYYVLTQSAKQLVRNLIYPVPDPEFPFLGVHFTRTINGDIEAGPNAVFAAMKEGYKNTDINFSELADSIRYKGFRKLAWKYRRSGLKEIQRSFSKKKFVHELRKLVPNIKPGDITKGGAGVRAQACDDEGNLIDDFLIIQNENVINVCNAPSPGATSSLSIGLTISELC